MPSELFKTDISIETTRRLFKEYINTVELENHNYCNRVCWFCPNSKVDRHTNITIMNEAIFNKIVGSLKEINYNGRVLWSLYHEPLAHNSIFERIATVKSNLPDAKAMLITNGDYLTVDILKQLAKAKLDILRISYYSEKKDPIDEIELFISRINLKIIRIDNDKIILSGAPFEVILYHKAFANIIPNSRGGIVQKVHTRRLCACTKPIYHFVIESSGLCMLCCETMSSFKEHASAIIGDLNLPESNIFEIFRTNALKREYLASAKTELSMCKYCNVDLKRQFTRRFELADRLMKLVPGYLPLYLKLRRIKKNILK